MESQNPGARVACIDALRGFVMLLMLVDHVRETFYLYVPLGDPVDPAATSPALFLTRLTSTLCAPAFIALTGLAAWYYRRAHSARATSAFLLKRGALLLVLEIALVNFTWVAPFPPPLIYLQVIWCIGLCMLALAALLHLPARALLLLGALLVCGHNLLSGVAVESASPFYWLWALLLSRETIPLTAGLALDTNYPVLPWIGVIALGYALGPWFEAARQRGVLARRLCWLGAALLLAFAALRWLNFYGDAPWRAAHDGLGTAFAFVALTKYPPSLLFLLSTLGAGALAAALFQRYAGRRWVEAVAVFGAAPMFFYLLHLVVLKALYLIAVAVWGANHGPLFGFESVGALWLCALVLAPALYFATRCFAQFKQRRRDIVWLKYF